MKSALKVLVAVALAAAGTGCIAVSSKGNRFGSGADAVAVNGRVYLVNKTTGDVREIDISHAPKFVAPPEGSNGDAEKSEM